MKSLDSTYWDKIYYWAKVTNVVSDSELIDTLLIDQENQFRGNKIFVRQCYKDIMKLSIWDQKFLFFTGTPGIGKTVFRNYVVGSQIQKLKAEKGDSIFVLGKSPRTGAPMYVMQMMKGEIVWSGVFDNCDELRKKLREINPNRSIRGNYHFDVSEGNIYDTFSTENSLCCFYTPPNEKSWKEKCKVSTRVIYLPGWSQKELEGYLLTCGMNKPLLLKLGVKSEHIDSYNDSTLWFAEVSRSPTPASTSFLLKVKDASTSAEYEYTIDIEIFRRALNAEIEEFGPIPSNMFLPENGLKMYKSCMEQATTQVGSLSDSEGTRHQLVMFVRTQNLKFPFSYDSSEYTTDWISRPICIKALESLAREHLVDLESNYFSSFARIAPHLDRKHIKRLLVFCLAAKPKTFKMELRSNVTPRRLPFSSDKSFSFPSILDMRTIKVRCLSNSELEEFAISGEDNSIAIAFNDYYSGIDAIANITLSPSAGGENVRTTVFMKVVRTMSTKHSFDPVDLENLKQLLTKIRNKTVEETSREVGFFWIVQDASFKEYDELKDIVPQFVVFPNMATDVVTTSQPRTMGDYLGSLLFFVASSLGTGFANIDNFLTDLVFTF